jgi:hypothetical protein
MVTLKPASASDNNGISVNLPYYLVERARSQLTAQLSGDFGPRRPTSTVRLRNVASAAQTGYGDFYAWGLSGTRQGAAPFDVRAVGVQSFPYDATTNLMVFAVNTFDRFNTAANGEVDIFIDVDGDGNADYDVFSFDYGALTSPDYSGEAIVGVQNLKTGAIVMRFGTDTPTDGSTLLLPVYTSDIGLSPANPRFSYKVQSWNWNGDTNRVPGNAKFNAFTPAISNGDFEAVAPGKSVSVQTVIDPVEWAKTPALGVMVVNKENTSGEAQAVLLKVK